MGTLVVESIEFTGASPGRLVLAADGYMVLRRGEQCWGDLWFS